jgi:hypothetical protein
MTVRAIGGLFVFNLFILAVGAGVLWGMRGWRWWTDFVRLLGVAYLLGLSALMILMTFEIVIGMTLGFTTILLSGAGVLALGVVAGRLRGFTAPGMRPPDWRFPRISPFAALFVAGIIVYFEGFFRAVRLAGVAREWDSWAFWMPKAKELYVSGRLEPEFLLQVQQLPSYPPGLMTIHAAAFHAMGSADTTTLHAQHWFFAVGFVVAVIGLLAKRVHQVILFPLLLAFLVAPSLLDWITTVYADIPLGYLVAVAALLVLLWIEEKESWQLAAATVLLSGAMLTKREGMLFAACVLLAGLIASFAERHQLWRRLLAAGLVAFALVLPWRIWFTAHGLQGDGPDTGYVGAFSYFDRVWPAVEISATTLFNRDLWDFAPAVAAVAILLALLSRAWTLSLYVGSFVIATVAAASWVLWSNRGLALTSDEWTTRRLMGTTVLVLAVLTPLLLTRAWSSEPASRASIESPGPDAFLRRSRAAWVIVIVGVLSHPVSMLVGYSGSGLPGGVPHLGSVASCVSSPAPGQRVRVVVGYARSYPEAVAIRRRAQKAGLSATEVAQDGCGRLRVYVDDVRAVEESEPLLAEARAARLTPTIESDTDG